MRWIGNNHAKAGEATVLKYMASSDTTLAREAMLAASKIGGNTMLADLLKYVSGQNAKQAKAALLSFNGKINGPGAERYPMMTILYTVLND